MVTGATEVADYRFKRLGVGTSVLLVRLLEELMGIECRYNSIPNNLLVIIGSRVGLSSHIGMAKSYCSNVRNEK